MVMKIVKHNFHEFDDNGMKKESNIGRQYLTILPKVLLMNTF